jgi:hypothetical protein
VLAAKEDLLPQYIGGDTIHSDIEAMRENLIVHGFASSAYEIIKP